MNRYGLFDLAYADALREIMNAAPHRNERTGKTVRARAGIALHVPENYYPLLHLRDIKPLWTCAEVVWFLSGSNSAEWMEEFGFRVWKEFADEHGHVWSATGYRWREHFGVDQVKALIDKLRRDPSNRQGVLLSWDPVMDMVNPGPNAPCVMIWHLHCIGEALFMSVLQRSADMYFGLPHDILGAKLVLDLIAPALGMRSGGLSYMISNAHLYEDQWPAAEEMIARAETLAGRDPAEWASPDQGQWTLGMTAEHFARAMVGDKALVGEMHERLMLHYSPMAAIKGPRLVK